MKKVRNILLWQVYQKHVYGWAMMYANLFFAAPAEPINYGPADECHSITSGENRVYRFLGWTLALIGQISVQMEESNSRQEGLRCPCGFWG